jgi:hypothetical protein
MRQRLPRSVVASTVVAMALALLLPAQAAYAFDDVPSNYWDHDQIDWVATTHTWMQDYGTKTFQPTTNELRKYLARTIVTVYAPSEQPDPKIKIKDVPQSDPFWRYINVAVKLAWMPLYKSGNFAPNGAIKVAGFDHAMVLALGLAPQVAALQNVHMQNGTKYKLISDFPYLTLAHVLQLHKRHTEDESKNIERDQLITRDEVAYSFWWTTDSTHGMSWQLSHAKSWYNSIVLPTLDPKDSTGAAQIAATTYSLNMTGYPYIYAGEWYTESPPGYCCGYQPIGGFDCSGLMWWVMKQYEKGYNAAQFRSYPGWSLLERSSYQMAEYTDDPIAFGNLVPGDLMFFASNKGHKWSDVDHVGMYLGNDWFVHSATTNDGVVLDWVGSGTYYAGTFVYGRRLIGAPPLPRGGDGFVVTKDTLLMGDQR